ncbi:MAG: DUF1501 domain-containing protein [Oligoflexales bacterium]
MTNISRRDFAKFGLWNALTLPLVSKLEASEAKENDHFFLGIIVSGGLDVSYTFDARPRTMRDAGKLAIYFDGTDDERLIPWQGKNGQATLATKFVKPLIPFKNEISIVNGVLMTPQFDGHTENLNYLLTNNPFGGDAFMPVLSERGSMPLDYVATQLFGANIRNNKRGLSIDSNTGAKLADFIRAKRKLDLESRIVRFAKERMEHGGKRNDRFGSASGLMGTQLASSPDLETRLSQMKFQQSEDGDSFARDMAFIGEVFRNKVAQSMIINLFSGNVDSHDSESASEYPTLVEEVSLQVAQIFQFLKDTPFDNTRSLWDVTTVMLTSEFSRTMRQQDVSIDQSGTDHNSLNNTVILAGRGIRPGLVIGQTDFQTSDENLSGAHKSLDPKALKFVGKPFDFKAHTPKSSSPDTFDQSEYLNFSSIVNTLYAAFGVSKDRYLNVGRDLGVAPVLSNLIS